VKLNQKLTLYFALSKLIIIALFVLLLPTLFDWYSVYTIDKFLKIQRERVFKNIKDNGLEFYLEGADSYGSYTMLKEDYISIQPIQPDALIEQKEIDDQIRVIGQDTAEYRILRNVFTEKGNYYLLEIGRSQQTIDLYSSLLRQVGLFLLIVLCVIASIMDFYYSRRLLKPFWAIINERLIKQRFPFNLHFAPIKTNTADFILLDHALQTLMENINKAFSREREFTANASHELLTPINILQNKIENIIVEEGLSEKQLAKLGEMSHTLERLRRIVRALLFLARIESRQYAQKDTVMLKELVLEICDELRPMLEEKDIQLAIHMTTHHIKNTNRELIFHLFYNIINNAIRYNVVGGKINIYDRQLNDLYHVCIEDTGKGIPPEHIPHLFSRFSHDHGSGRYGLGLSIVKSIADLFDIHIDVASQQNKGTTITMTFKKKPSF